MSLPGKVLLDTSVVIEHFKGNLTVTAALEATDYLFLPCIALGELYYGALRSHAFEKHSQQINLFLQAVTLVSIDKDSAFHYAHIRAALAQAGKPIPENDIWIAALAIQHELPLATRDNHFEHIASITLIRW